MLCRRRHNHDLRHTLGTRMITKADIRRVANATFQKNNRTVAMSKTRAAATKESTR